MTCPVCCWCGLPIFGQVCTHDAQQYHPHCSDAYIDASLSDRLRKGQLTAIAIVLAPIAKTFYAERQSSRTNRLVLFRPSRPYAVRVAPWNYRNRRKMV